MTGNESSYLPKYFETIRIILYILFFLLSGLVVFYFIARGLSILIFGIDPMFATQDLSDPTYLWAMTLIQALTLTGIFLTPAFLTPLVLKKRINDYLAIKNPLKFEQLFAFVILFVVAFPFLEWTIIINQKMELPAFLSGLENWMQAQESDRAELTFAIAHADNIFQLLIKLGVIALIPAICEEFFFRGLLLKFFTDWTKRVHLAIFIGAFLFSAIHMQFYGFLPRFLLGLLFGYTVYYSGTIWIAVILHFINNSFAVLIIFINDLNFNEFQNQGETMEYSNIVTILSLGLAALIFLSLAFYYNRKRDKSGDWVKVFSTRSKQEADIIRTKLEEAGIHSVLMNKSGSTFHFIGPAEVYVAPEDEEKAQKILIGEDKDE